MATYLPTANLTPLYKFTQFTTLAGVSALETALRTDAPTQNVQVYADTQTTGNALVVANDQRAISVPPNSYVGYNRGTWAIHTAAELNGDANSLYKAYP